MISTTWISQQDLDTRIELHIQPRASRSAIVGIYDQRLKISLKSPPVDGAANKELLAFLAKLLRTKKSAIKIISGKSGRRKSVLIKACKCEEIKKQLLA